MRQAVIAILNALLITGPTAQIATASGHHTQNARRVLSAIGEQFRNANDPIARRANGFCSQEPENPLQEPENPFTEQIDYLAGSAFRESRVRDSQNDCQ
jgi:hypothetical protein